MTVRVSCRLSGIWRTSTRTGMCSPPTVALAPLAPSSQCPDLRGAAQLARTHAFPASVRDEASLSRARRSAGGQYPISIARESCLTHRSPSSAPTASSAPRRRALRARDQGPAFRAQRHPDRRQRDRWRHGRGDVGSDDRRSCRGLGRSRGQQKDPDLREEGIWGGVPARRLRAAVLPDGSAIKSA